MPKICSKCLKEIKGNYYKNIVGSMICNECGKELYYVKSFMGYIFYPNKKDIYDYVNEYKEKEFKL